MEFTAQRVRAKTRAAVKRREDQIETEEMESGELNLIPYLDMVTNLMLFLLASVSAGLILVQIDTTLPDRKVPSPNDAPKPQVSPDDQPLGLIVSITEDKLMLYSSSRLEGTITEPKLVLPRTGKDGAVCDSPSMCESNACDEKTAKCVPSKDEPQPVYDYRALNHALLEIATRRYTGKQRKDETYRIVLQADERIPYSTIVSTMTSMRCKLPALGEEVKSCAQPTDDAALKAAPEPISPDKKLYDTTRATYDPNTMALFPEIGFSADYN